MVLEASGHKVVLPEQKLCCGRPLYDFGMLDQAKKMLANILLSMRQEIRADIKVVGLEPSCVSVFRDELNRLFPYDEDAQRLSKNAMTISEFLVEHSQFEFPKLNRKAIVHGHCHDKAVMKMKCEAELYKSIGLEFEILDSGCCGMAGSFGFEIEHYEISVKCGERILLPRVRETPQETYADRRRFQLPRTNRATGKSPGVAYGGSSGESIARRQSQQSRRQKNSRRRTRFLKCRNNRN